MSPRLTGSNKNITCGTRLMSSSCRSCKLATMLGQVCCVSGCTKAVTTFESSSDPSASLVVTDNKDRLSYRAESLSNKETVNGKFAGTTRCGMSSGMVV